MADRVPRERHLVVPAERDDRVRLQRRHGVALELAALEAQVAEVERDESNLRMLEGRLANQVDEFVARQQVIVARYNAAEAQIQIKEAVTGVSREFAELTAALTEAEEKTEGMEARVSAIDRLVREGLLGVNDQVAEDPSGWGEEAWRELVREQGRLHRAQRTLSASASEASSPDVEAAAIETEPPETSTRLS